MEYYGRRSQEPTIEIAYDDPPDLIVRLPQEKMWGVEVTRVYDQAQSIGGRGALHPSKGISEGLLRFGEQVGNATHGIRKRDYTLLLNAPSPVLQRDEPLRQQAFSIWKDKVARKIRAHVEGDSPDKLIRIGLYTISRRPGNQMDRHGGRRGSTR